MKFELLGLCNENNVDEFVYFFVDVWVLGVI